MPVPPAESTVPDGSEAEGPDTSSPEELLSLVRDSPFIDLDHPIGLYEGVKLFIMAPVVVIKVGARAFSYICLGTEFCKPNPSHDPCTAVDFVDCCGGICMACPSATASRAPGAGLRRHPPSIGAGTSLSSDTMDPGMGLIRLIFMWILLCASQREGKSA